MPNKAARTTAYIIETVAPIFNKHGYIGTSMSDLTSATGLTKGALYGNFENKEALALAAFDYHKNILLTAIREQLHSEGSALDRIFALTNFYRKYDEFTMKLGGCPVLNVGTDAQFNHSKLAEAAKGTVKTIIAEIAAVLEDGITKKEIHLPVASSQFAKQMYTMIQGAVGMATIMQDRKYLLNTIAYLEQLIKKEIKK